MKKSIVYLAMCLLSVGSLSACNKQDPETPGNKPYEPIVLTKAEQEIKTASNQFGFDVYHQLYKGENMLVSPLSLSLALSMTATGAAGQTAEEMLSTLGFAGQSIDDMNGYYKKMISALLEADPTTTFEVANSIWANEKAAMKKSFADLVNEYYSSEVYPADFSSQATVNAVNKWVSDKTHGKIDSILDKPNPNLVMALINALYFKGKWSFDFDEKTNKEDFTMISGKKMKVDMMKASEKLDYAESDGFSMVNLPYGNGAFSMKVILPAKNEDFGDAVARLDANVLARLNGSLSKANVNLKLPKFTFDYNSDLAEVLSDLGMKQAFLPTADFSSMSDRSLSISLVKQKTFIDVNEKGTEAAAVTFIGMVATSMGPQQIKNVNFFADRPFLFVIQENSTGAILFMGQKVD